VALTGPAPPLDPAREFPAPRRWCQNSFQLFPTVLEGNTRASSYRTLAPLRGAISHPTLFRRSRPASTLRLPSFTPSGWGNRRLKALFLNRNPNLNRNLPFSRSEGPCAQSSLYSRRIRSARSSRKLLSSFARCGEIRRSAIRSNPVRRRIKLARRTMVVLVHLHLRAISA
jgi:hypothetical protein